VIPLIPALSTRLRIVLITTLIATTAGALLVPDRPASAQTVGDNAVVATDALNLRDDSSLDGSILGILFNSEVVTVTDGPVVADGYNWYEVDTSLGSGWVAGDFLSEGSDPGFATGDVAVVATDALNLRAAATTTGTVIDVLVTGASLTIVSGPISAVGYSWYRVSSTAGTGWVAGEFLGSGSSGAGALDIGDGATVDIDLLNLRDAAGLDGEVIAQMVTGDDAYLIDGPVSADGYTWYQVETF
jgi:uncharacterized protein YgiM (DUF1202 family)